MMNGSNLHVLRALCVIVAVDCYIPFKSVPCRRQSGSEVTGRRTKLCSSARGPGGRRGVKDRRHTSVADLKESFQATTRDCWDDFYRRNNKYRDRHYLVLEFPDLVKEEVLVDRQIQWGDGTSVPQKAVTLLELGCGNGNSVFPLLRSNPNLFVHAVDLSPSAITALTSEECFHPGRCHAFSCDVTSTDLREHIAPGSCDFITMVYFLSALHPDQTSAVLEQAFHLLKPGGSVLLRDYGIGDFTQTRYSAEAMVADNFYARSDGTCCQYFSPQSLDSLFSGVGLETQSGEFKHWEVVNRKEDITMQRVWVQAQFSKPH